MSHTTHEDSPDNCGGTPTTEPYGDVDIDQWGQRKLGDWIQTYTCKEFHPLDISPEDLDIDDIAHALSLVNRFTGHTHGAYSVAEHSVRVMWAVDNLDIGWKYDEDSITAHRKIQLEALLHDATEAYIADLARPIKMMPQMAAYRALEEIVDQAIRSKYGLPDTMSPIVKRADVILLMTEKRDLMGLSPRPWTAKEKPLPEKIKPWSADLAEYRFREEYYNLLEKLGIED